MRVREIGSGPAAALNQPREAEANVRRDIAVHAEQLAHGAKCSLEAMREKRGWQPLGQIRGTRKPAWRIEPRGSALRSRDLLARITRDDVSADAFKFRDLRQTFVGDVPVILNRISFSGELGYEIHCKPQYLLRLASAVEDAGADLGYHWYGVRALMSMRLEKGWGVWTLEFRPDFDAVESGMEVFINWKKDFVGKEALKQIKKQGPSRRLVGIELPGEPMKGSNNEFWPVLHEGKKVGRVTRCIYSPRLEKNIGFANIEASLQAIGTELSIKMPDSERPAFVCKWPWIGAEKTIPAIS